MKAIKLMSCAALATMGIALLGACSDDTTADSGSQGSAQMLLTDGPFPYSGVARADVYVQSVSVLTTDPSSTQLTDTTSGSGWVTVATPGKTFDMVALRHGTTANLGLTTLKAGTYHGVRMIVIPDSSSVTLTNGTVLTTSNGGLSAPSGGRTAIKVILHDAVDANTTTKPFILDFDLANSFVLKTTTAAGGFNFRPVIRGFLQSTAGKINGTLKDSVNSSAVADATVQVVTMGTSTSDTTAANLIASTSTDANGAFSFELLPPGSYQIRVFKNSGSLGAQMSSQSSVAVTAGGTTSVSVLLGINLTLGSAQGGN